MFQRMNELVMDYMYMIDICTNETISANLFYVLSDGGYSAFSTPPFRLAVAYNHSRVSW
jgi:hypothetical protein